VTEDADRVVRAPESVASGLVWLFGAVVDGVQEPGDARAGAPPAGQ